MSGKKKVLGFVSILGIVAVAAAGYVGYCQFTGRDMLDTPSTENVTITDTEIEANEEYVDPHVGMVENQLDGTWITEKKAQKRPIAIMINNIREAIPQSGVSKADVVYEILAEGGITRLMALYDDYSDLPKIGPVRSARHYYCDIANEYDAVYVHYGQTKYAVSKMNELKLDHISGLDYVDGTVFYRDYNRVAPHNAYISTDGIDLGFDKTGTDKKRSEPVVSHFKWNEEPEKLKDGESAKKVTLGFSNYTTPYFTYNKKTKQYDRFQYGQPQIDDQNNKQLVFDNIIIQEVEEWDIDHNGYQTMKLTGTGNGYYITRGKQIPITWKRSRDGVTRYCKANGKQIRMNKGKTYIAVFPKHRRDLIVFE